MSRLETDVHLINQESTVQQTEMDTAEDFEIQNQAIKMPLDKELKINDISDHEKDQNKVIRHQKNKHSIASTIARPEDIQIEQEPIKEPENTSEKGTPVSIEILKIDDQFMTPDLESSPIQRMQGRILA